MEEIKKLQPRAFTRFCMTIGAVPSSYLEGMTVERQLLWFCSYLEKEVIPAVNQVGGAVEELQTLYNQLLEYVNNYFDNLDVQEEINNKLDDMAESGELADIIAQYVNLQSVLAYNTKAEMKAAENLVDGSIARTLGTTTYNDGLGNFYKIREVLNTDVIDDDNIIALHDPELVAEKIGDKRLDDIEDDIDDLQVEITNNKITILIGDSYGQGTTGWCTKYKSQNNLTEGTDVYTVAQGGYGFVGDNSQTYLSELQSLASTITNKGLVDKIIVAGGWNDRGHASGIESAILSFMTYAKTNYPKAHVYCGMISNYKAINDQAESLYWRPVLQKSILLQYKKIEKYGGSYLNGVECVMHIYDRFQSDDIHPTEDGNIEIARAITQAVYNGTYNAINTTEYITIDSNNYTLGANVLNTTNFALAINVHDNIVHTEFNGYINTNNISTTYTSLNLQVCQYTNSQKWFRFVDTNSRMNVTLAVKYNSTNYKILPGFFTFERDGYLHLRTRAEVDLANISEIAVIGNNTCDNFLQDM